MLPVETFNSAPVQNLAHLAHLVDSSDDPYLNFGLDGGRFITLDRQQVGIRMTGTMYSLLVGCGLIQATCRKAACFAHPLSYHRDICSLHARISCGA